MTVYVLRVLVKMAITLFVIVSATFLATRLSGSPLETFLGEGLTAEGRQALIDYFELDRSLWHQYLAYLRGVLSGEFGLGFVERRPVTEIVADRIWPSLQLLLASIGLTLAVSIPLGVIAAATLLALGMVFVSRGSESFDPIGMIMPMSLLAIAFSSQLLPVTFDVLFLKRGTRQGAIAGIVAGMLVVLMFSPLLAIVTGVGLTLLMARRAGVHPDVIFSMSFWCFIFGIIGARLVERLFGSFNLPVRWIVVD